ncbi:DUF5808 domain-containing protein [Paenibacillus sp. JCM 10914]
MIIILSLTTLVCYFALWITYRPQAKYKNGMLFAVLLPEHALAHPDIQAIQANFKRSLNRITLWMLIAYIPFLLLHDWMAYQMLYYFAWLTVFLIVMVLPFRRAFRDTLARKREHDWFVGQKEEVLDKDGQIIYSEGDEYWSSGFTYHNPNDKRVMVTKRVGIGETVNTGTVAGKIVIWGAIGLAAVTILGTSFMMIRSEWTSPKLAITSDHRIEIDYPMYSFDFSMTEIQELSLEEHVPPGSKRNGESMDKYARGHFRLEGIGKTRLYIFKNNPPYIKFKLGEGYVFYNDEDPARTRQVYEELEKRRAGD